MATAVEGGTGGAPPRGRRHRRRVHRPRGRREPRPPRLRGRPSSSSPTRCWRRSIPRWPPSSQARSSSARRHRASLAPTVTAIGADDVAPHRRHDACRRTSWSRADRRAPRRRRSPPRPDWRSATAAASSSTTQQRTSDPHIYAVGDAVEKVRRRRRRGPPLVPLAQHRQPPGPPGRRRHRRPRRARRARARHRDRRRLRAAGRARPAGTRSGCGPPAGRTG